MRILKTIMAVILACSVPTASSFAAAGAEVDKVKACLSCHNAAISLRGKGASVIASQMKTIRAGDKGHPPGLTDLTDEEITEIAAYLDGA